jgi:predicted TIM-barrel fold metal-dependent hydrolase
VEYGVADKVLFGTDYPFTTLEASLAGLRNINKVVEGTGMPRVPEEVIEGIIHRDTLGLLGLS